MGRDEEIQKIAKRIQKDINKLKNLNCSIDYSEHSISVFDDNIKPKKGLLGAGDDYQNVVVFSFNTSRL
jgi:hypothetical protein